MSIEVKRVFIFAKAYREPVTKAQTKSHFREYMEQKRQRSGKRSMKGIEDRWKPETARKRFRFGADGRRRVRATHRPDRGGASGGEGVPKPRFLAFALLGPASPLACFVLMAFV